MARPNPEDVPGPHPDPPADLSDRPLPTFTYAVDTQLDRIYRLGREARFFGQAGTYRWDAPSGEFGVMYAAATPFGAFAETVLPAPGEFAAITTSVSLGATVPVSATAVASHGLAIVTVTESLHCVDLRGSGLAHLGADARLTSGSHAVAQRWSLAFWSHPSAPDGIAYLSRRDPAQTAVAIYDRAGAKIRVDESGGLKEPQHRVLLAEIYMRYHVAELP